MNKDQTIDIVDKQCDKDEIKPIYKHIQFFEEKQN